MHTYTKGETVEAHAHNGFWARAVILTVGIEFVAVDYGGTVAILRIKDEVRPTRRAIIVGNELRMS